MAESRKGHKKEDEEAYETAKPNQTKDQCEQLTDSILTSAFNL